MMGKFRKKPIVIFAFRYATDFFSSDAVPQEFKDAVCKMRCMVDKQPHIHTLEGNFEVSLDDWIIKGIQGEFYPCKPAIFDKTYEEVD